MIRLITAAGLMLGAGCILSAPAAGQSPGPRPADSEVAGWAAEQVRLRDGRCIEGLIESEDEAWVHLIEIQRPAGRPMFLVIRPIDRASIADVVRLLPPQRERLRQQIEQFRNRARIEAAHMESIRLTPIDREGAQYRRYRGKWFELESTADEPTTRRVIVRTEQIFTAYRQILPPRVESQRPLRLVVLNSMEEYEAYLGRRGIRINNPACFIPADNLVVVGSELARFAAQLADIQARHEQLRNELKGLEEQLPLRQAEISRRLKDDGAARDEVVKLLRIEKTKFDRQIEQKRKEVSACDRENARVFDDVTRQTFARFYHEALHAYLENYVYPSSDYDVPLWLNEGFAMVFEGGLIESQTLRIDAPNAAALARLQADLRGQQPLSLAEVLADRPQALLSAPGSERYYVYCWGLAYDLAFEQHLLAGPSLAEYVEGFRKDARGGDGKESTSPVARFERPVGMPLAKFEPAWRDYILGLR